MICLVSSQLWLRQTPALNSPSGGPGQPRAWGRGADVCSLSTVSLTATVTVGLSRRVLWSSENIYTNNNAPLLGIIFILQVLKNLLKSCYFLSPWTQYNGRDLKPATQQQTVTGDMNMFIYLFTMYD